MEADVLIKKIEQLPKNLQLKAADYIDSLLKEAEFGTVTNDELICRGYGSLKGIVTYIADDFDKPLFEFKDYQHKDVN